MNKIKSLYGIYATILLSLILGQQTLFKIGKGFENIQINQQIKAKQLENEQLKILITQKEKTLGTENQELMLENLLENRPLQIIQKNKNENILEITLAGKYSHLVEWFENLPGNRIAGFKLYKQQNQIWCEIRLKNVS